MVVIGHDAMQHPLVGGEGVGELDMKYSVAVSDTKFSTRGTREGNAKPASTQAFAVLTGRPERASRILGVEKLPSSWPASSRPAFGNARNELRAERIGSDLRRRPWCAYFLF